MAELCLKCFLEVWRPNAYDRAHVVMSCDNDFCEGCNTIGEYVDYIDPVDLISVKTASVSLRMGRKLSLACVECGEPIDSIELKQFGEVTACSHCQKRDTFLWVKE